MSSIVWHNRGCFGVARPTKKELGIANGRVMLIFSKLAHDFSGESFSLLTYYDN